MKSHSNHDDTAWSPEEIRQRLQCVIDLSADYYWEQDETLRFTLIHHRDIGRSENDPRLFLGKTLWELDGTLVHGDRTWDTVKTTLEAGKPFVDLLIWRIDRRTGEQYISISGQPVFDSSGRFKGYRGIARDVTKDKRDERLLGLERAVISILVDAENPSVALQAAVRIICQSEGWEAGQYWSLDRDNQIMRFYEGWCVADGAIEAVTAEAREFIFPYGRGLVGLVWQTGEPLWISDVRNDPRVLRKDVTSRTGWNSAFLFPVTSEGEVVGVLDFNAPYIPQPDERLLQVINVLGTQIGNYYQRAVALAQLRESEERYSSTIDLAVIGIAHVDPTGRFIHVNRQLCEMLGYSNDELLDMTVKDVSHHEDVNATDDKRTRLYAGEIDSFKMEKRYLHKQGTPIWVRLSVTVKRDRHGQPLYDVAVVEDITARKEVEDQLRESEERFHSTVELAAIGMSHVDPEGRIIHANRQLCEMLGYPSEELVGKTVKEVSHPEDVDVTDASRALLHAGEIDSFKEEKRYMRKDGAPVWVRIAVAVKRDRDGTPLYDIAVTEDISARRQAEERVQHLATHDGMTDLPNRMLFTQLLGQAVETGHRYGRKFAVLFIDLDRFKHINDSLGHEAGDLLLKEMSRRLKNSLRASDVVARLGGDEFVILIQEIQEPAQVAVVARNILSAVIRPVGIMEQECRVTASIGICMFPDDAQDEETLMKNADMAMYLAKEEGKNNFQFYTKEIKAHSIERLALESCLRTALERNEFSLHYQAKVNIKMGEIKGVEALLRWDSPELGSIPPAKFIPIAESLGVIIPMGKWVMKTACEQNLRWQRQGLSPVCLSINLSPRQFSDPDLVTYTRQVLEETGMAPELLELEITESMVMYNTKEAIKKLAQVKQLGVRVAIDDFGTGYSSLSQLKNFPIDTLKVDRSFIREIPKNHEDKALTEAIITMGKTLGLTVVAEGVETLEQQSFLEVHACDEMQGFYFSKPVEPDQFATLLRTHRPTTTGS